MFLKLNGSELKSQPPKKEKLQRAKSSSTLGGFAAFPLFPTSSPRRFSLALELGHPISKASEKRPRNEIALFLVFKEL